MSRRRYAASATRTERECVFLKNPLGATKYENLPAHLKRAGRLLFPSTIRRLPTSRSVIGPGSLASEARTRSRARSGKVHSAGGADQIFFSFLSNNSTPGPLLGSIPIHPRVVSDSSLSHRAVVPFPVMPSCTRFFFDAS